MISPKLMSRPVWRFAIRGVMVYALWFILYDLWLLPQGSLDEWVSRGVAWGSSLLLRLLGIGVVVSGRVAAQPGYPGVFVANGCNGLEVLGLFSGFVLAYPKARHSRALFILLGCLVIFLVNVLRVAGLIWVQGVSTEAFEWVHSRTTQVLFYLVVFALWVVWARLSDGVSAEAKALPQTTAAV